MDVKESKSEHITSTNSLTLNVLIARIINIVEIFHSEDKEMTKAGERAVVKAEGAYGGAGYILKEALITEAQMGEHCTMFHNVTIPVDCELGYHEHHGNTEAYYMLTGKGLYTDDDKQYEIEAGDVVFCEEGHGHGLKNTGDVDITFVALVLKK